MRTTATIHRRDNVIDLAQGRGQWTLSADDFLMPDRIATNGPAIDATDSTDVTPALNATDSDTSEVEPEWEWIQKNEGTLRENYGGLWIAVLADRVVAVGGDELAVLQGAEALGYNNVFTFYVSTDSEPVAMAGLVAQS